MPGALSSLPFGAFSLSLKLFLMILYSLDDDGEATLVHASLGSGKTPAACISYGDASDGDGGNLLHVAPLGSVDIQAAFLA